MVAFTGRNPSQIRQGNKNVMYESCEGEYRIFMEEGKEYELLFGKAEG